MNKTINKKLITESIQGWYVLDNILFDGCPDVYLKEHNDVLSNYNNLKKTFLKTVFEFYNLIGYKSSFITMPKTHGEIEHRALTIFEGLKHDVDIEFSKNKKKYCKIISEGVDFNNDSLLKKRTNFLGRSLMIENHFINKPLRMRKHKITQERLILIKNCLTEVTQQLLNISNKYFKKF